MAVSETARYKRGLFKSEKLKLMENQKDPVRSDFVKVGITLKESFVNSHTGRFVGRLRRTLRFAK